MVWVMGRGETNCVVGFRTYARVAGCWERNRLLVSLIERVHAESFDGEGPCGF